jgi:copper(I)-binding protein
MHRFRFIAIAATALAMLSASVLAQTDGKPEIHVDHAFARAAPRTGGAYLTITNTGTAPDRLLSAAATVAAEASLHESKMQNGVMTMRPLGPLTIAPGKTVALKPGGDHIMLMGLKEPLKPGGSFTLTLTFEKSGAVEVTVPVEKAGAMGPMPGMKMDPNMKMAPNTKME